MSCFSSRSLAGATDLPPPGQRGRRPRQAQIELRDAQCRPQYAAATASLNVNAATACVLSCFAHAVGYAEERRRGAKFEVRIPHALWRPRAGTRVRVSPSNRLARNQASRSAAKNNMLVSYRPLARPVSAFFEKTRVPSACATQCRIRNHNSSNAASTAPPVRDAPSGQAGRRQIAA